jgi:hypothetical protein
VTPAPAPQPVVEKPITQKPLAEKTAEKVPTPVTADMYSVVNNAEEDLIRKLAIKHAEETGLISKMKTLISETDEIEESEVALRKKLTELQELRRKIEAEPDSAEKLLQAADLHKDEVAAPPKKETKPEPPAAAPASVPPSNPPVVSQPTPTQKPLQPISPAQRVLTALQSTFASSDATIAAMLTADAKVERSADKNGVIIASPQGQIHFSNDDLKQAGIAMLELSDIPYAAPQVAAEPTQAATVAEPAPVAAVQTPAPATPSVPSAPAPAELTPAMKKLIAILEKKPPVSIADMMKNITSIYRSPDGNGVLIMGGGTTIRVSDAELIQSNVSGEDVVDLPAGSPEMMPV